MLLVGGGGRGCEVGLSPCLTALFWCDSERIFYYQCDKPAVASSEFTLQTCLVPCFMKH